eukprot:11484586-Alexandrium_andersonii.AAC.1
MVHCGASGVGPEAHVEPVRVVDGARAGAPELEALDPGGVEHLGLLGADPALGGPGGRGRVEGDERPG